ncbi:GntR family transcriptional regulator [Oxalicibacterium flavum]|uniref:GntR family transcriptional regulator n=1 Tax=Oxalicibacterium flavum TaxID=179467 RepID=A0A8J2UL55_9BURK|nr:GntR family transcriptional regulator [Oxalicibacterium flavum]GGC08674.1 GntR family transcriptional regulator [Oxalicibacterium flavum]
MPKDYKTVEQYVLNQLRRDILGGRYQPGDRLRQDEVARRFEVSTTPVREAFRDLRSEGLVWIDTNKGVIVKGLTVKDVAEIYELRIALEPLLARKSVATIAPDALEAARLIHHEMSASSDPHRWAALNKEFHVTLMASEKDTRLYDMVRNLLVIAEPYVSLSIFIHPQILATDNIEHEQILEGYEKKNARSVERIVKQHLEQTLLAIQNSVDENSLRLMSKAFA